MSLIQQVLVDEGYKNLNWFERHVAEDRVDDLIVCFAGLSEKIPDFPLAPGPKFHKDYYQVMHGVVPVIEEKQTPSLDSRSESEFDSNQEDHGGTEDPDLISAEAVIKAGWRECKDAQQFVDLVGLGNMAAQCLVLLFSEEKEEVNFITWIKEAAEDYLGQVQHCLQAGLWQGIQWMEIQPSPDKEENDLIFIYSELLTISLCPKNSKLSAYHDLLQRLLPKDENLKPRGLSQSSQEAVFYRDIEDTRRITPAVYEEVLKRFQEFRPREKWLGPFTAIIGPQESGKTSVMGQIAQQGYTYVAYVSFAEPNSTTFLGRSELAHRSRSPGGKDVYIGISPRVFFDLQVRKHFGGFQERLRWALLKCHSDIDSEMFRIRGQFRGKPDHESFSEILTKYVERYKQNQKIIFVCTHAKWKTYQEYHHLMDVKDDELVIKEGHPSVLLCFDESGGLVTIAEDEMVWFEKLIKAICNRSHDQWGEKDRFFSVFLDRKTRDPYLKSPASHKEVFKPIDLD
ncbi:hypothetical protein AWENTII_007486 [Aspergillus wentii]|nr:hypothetical protein MW887_011308 [Aspergillus wentii]